MEEKMSDMDKMKELTRDFENLLNEDYKEQMKPKTSLLEDLEDLVGDYECDCDFGSTINITTQGCQSSTCGTTIPQHPDVTGYAFQII